MPQVEPPKSPEARDAMDSCIGSIKTGKPQDKLRRGSSVEDAMAHVQYTSQKPPALQSVMETLGIESAQVGYEAGCDKFILQRAEGPISFVYLRATKQERHED